jgi:L-seryl-tRNA(Ser) seleniumtransferase
MRPDKVTLLAVAATLAIYRAGTATRDIPVWRMISASLDDLRARAERLKADVAGVGRRSVEIADVESTVGGGSLPGQTLPSVGLRLTGRGADALLARLRGGSPAIVGRIDQGAVILDLRTVDERDDGSLRAGLERALRATG